jgi:hypothetical protein
VETDAEAVHILKEAANFQCALDYSHLLTVHIFFDVLLLEENEQM